MKRAFKISKGDTICYLDVDLATSMRYMSELIEYSKDHDVVFGSRYMPGSVVRRPHLRESVSRIYNSLIRNVIGCQVFDVQIGFKAFSRRFVDKEIMKINEKSWAWDTIVVVEAIKKGYKVKEFPVKWKEKKEIELALTAC